MHSAARFQLATVASPATPMMASLESSTSAAMRCIRPYLTAGTRSSPGESKRSSRGAPESFDTARPRTISGLVISHAHVLIGINSYAGPPSPAAEYGSYGHGRAKADSAANGNPRPRRGEDHQGIVVGQIMKTSEFHWVSMQ